ncbi:MAG: EthD domain-containing protein, partial [Sphingomonadaceae bacterium]
MLKLIYSLARKEGMSREAFQRYWREVHAPLVAQAAPVLGIRRYVQAHSVETALDEAFHASRPLERPAYDGHAELWFDSEEAMVAALASADGQAAAQRLLEDEAQFIDFTKSRMVLARENPVV